MAQMGMMTTLVFFLSQPGVEHFFWNIHNPPWCFFKSHGFVLHFESLRTLLLLFLISPTCRGSFTEFFFGTIDEDEAEDDEEISMKSLQVGQSKKWRFQCYSYQGFCGDIFLGDSLFFKTPVLS